MCAGDALDGGAAPDATVEAAGPFASLGCSAWDAPPAQPTNTNEIDTHATVHFPIGPLYTDRARL